MSIRMIVFDIDGCLTPGEGSEWDLEAISRVRNYSLLSRNDASVPGITILSGRQQPYVEAVCQALGIRLPAVFESGAGMFFLPEFRIKTHPLISLSFLDSLADFQKRLRRELADSGIGFVQPGKSCSLTVYPPARGDMDRLGGFLRRSIQSSGMELQLDRGVLCFNLLHRGINKAEGLRRLCEETGIGAEEIAAMGDSESDLPFLELAGFSACPANATDGVKRAVDCVSAHAHAAACLELAEKCVAMNRRNS